MTRFVMHGNIRVNATNVTATYVSVENPKEEASVSQSVRLDYTRDPTAQSNQKRGCTSPLIERTSALALPLVDDNLCVCAPDTVSRLYNNERI